MGAIEEWTKEALESYPKEFKMVQGKLERLCSNEIKNTSGRDGRELNEMCWSGLHPAVDDKRRWRLNSVHFPPLRTRRCAKP